MTLTISLLGTAGAERDGRAVEGIRGRKAWAILAYLLLAGAPVSRQRLDTMFFPEAKDPSGALRWNLSQLRRQLGVTIDGDPVVLTLPADARVDAHLLGHLEAGAALALPGLGEDLLAGAWPDQSPAFEVWFESERRHLRALSADIIREAALQRLAHGDHDAAVALAERVVGLEPLDENAAVLLVRTLRAAGRGEEARTVVTSATERLRRELGVEPGEALRSALHHRPGGTRHAGAHLTIEADREAGIAALSAGAVDTGIDLLREALGGARALDDPALLARTLSDLGSALVHAVRGADQDATPLLHEVVSLHERVGDPALMAMAMRELGYVEMLRGRYPRAAVWFDRAASFAGEDETQLAWIDTFSGAAQTDVADCPRAGRTLEEAVERAETIDSPPLQTMARAMRGRLHLLTGDLDAAAVDLDRAVDLGTRHGLRSMLPWPATLRAEVDLRVGNIDGAAVRFQKAYATSQQIGDPCWEAMALRGIGLVAVERGKLPEGVEHLDAAAVECRRLPDTYRWVEAYALDSLTALGVQLDLEPTPGWAKAFDELTTDHGMRQLSLHAARHRAALGEPGAEALLELRQQALAATSAPT
ncbi:MAG: BTAD domain-containing putative transcriptional regulator [Nitriliruptoraceae bacterium]